MDHVNLANQGGYAMFQFHTFDTLIVIERKIFSGECLQRSFAAVGVKYQVVFLDDVAQAAGFLQKKSARNVVLLSDFLYLDVYLAVEALRTFDPEVRIVLLEKIPRVSSTFVADRQGLQGYWTCDDPFEDLADGLERVFAGKCLLGPSAAYLLTQSGDRLIHRDGLPHCGLGDLRPRELTCLVSIVQYREVNRCAREMGIARRTVENYIHRIKRKLDAHTLADLVFLAHAYNIMD